MQEYIDLVMKMDRKAFCARVTVPLLVAEVRRKPLSFSEGSTDVAADGKSPHILHLGHMQQVFEIRQKKPDPEGQVTLGRSDECDLIVADETVSSKHAVIQRDQASGQYQIQDLSSRNGSRINGQPIEPGTQAQLTSGDNLQVGDAAFVFFRPEGLYDALELTYKSR
jgi:hypothetical protein